MPQRETRQSNKASGGIGREQEFSGAVTGLMSKVEIECCVEFVNC
jgi:hypothetical protein